DPHQPHTLTDQLDGTTYTWHRSNYVHLDPRTRPAHILTFQRNGGHVRADGNSVAENSVENGRVRANNGTKPKPKPRRGGPRRSAGGRPRPNGT
ncbi:MULTISPECIES: hypothetical protein, partial [unclassified Spirillospora]|uniref:hypothetical protein n=1 Tax=unclassified Spirillospora TaxID=2642701 RepID=UPI0037212931